MWVRYLNNEEANSFSGNRENPIAHWHYLMWHRYTQVSIYSFVNYVPFMHDLFSHCLWQLVYVYTGVSLRIFRGDNTISKKIFYLIVNCNW